MVSSAGAARAVPHISHPVDRVVRGGARLAVLAVLAVALLPLAFHARTLVVLSGSMTPALRVGDLVVAQQVPAATARPGDVVTFPDPAGSGRLFTHRVRQVTRAAGSVRFVTRGDAARGSERWHVPARSTVGLVRYRLPALGYPLARVRSPLGRLALVASLALVAIGWAGRRRRVLA